MNVIENSTETIVPTHPLGVKPLGNAYTAEENIKAKAGLFALLPDELIIQAIEWLNSDSLVRLGSTCRTLYAFSRHDELWKSLFLVAEEFAEEWADNPFILTEPVREWPAYRQWSSDLLVKKYSDTFFRAESVDWPLKVYKDYISDNQDESPLYLFDRSFVEKMHLSVGEGNESDYWPPACFGEDLFDVLEDQRPDRRWLIVGPERSGSSFHKDPNATSAWNAVLRGSKYWIMFPTTPSTPPPPGVYVSEDQSEVTSPLSITEWLLDFHAEARKTHGCREGICEEGEVLHVPSGWWHLVVNLSPSIAITQNFVPQAHLASTLLFLRDKPQQVSGFKSDVKDPYNLFVTKLREKHPGLLQKGLLELDKLQANKKRKWQDLVGVAENEGGDRNGFTFGFGDGDEEDEQDVL
ncbi:MAG: hypothetical protein Q9220_001386 [cf. Caloplaca sp. 1 TL-2023]